MFSTIRDQPEHQRPGAQLSSSSAHLNDCLETIKQAFEAVATENAKLKLQVQDVERMIDNQVNELHVLNEAMHELEAHHSHTRQEYDNKVLELHNRLQDVRLQARDRHYPGSIGPVNVAAGPPRGLNEQEQAPNRQGRPHEPGARPGPTLLAPLQCPRSQPSQTFPARQQASRSSQGTLTQASGVPGLSMPPTTAHFNPKAQRTLDVDLMHTLSHESTVCCVRFSADGLFLATGCYRFARVYDVKTGQMEHELEAGVRDGPEMSYVRCLSFSPSGKRLATSADDTKILLWDITLDQKLTTLHGHAKAIYSLEFSSDGSRIVSGSADGTVRIWDLETGRCVTLTAEGYGPTDVMSISMSPDGQLIAAGSLDAVIRVWDVASGAFIGCLRGHRSTVTSLAFTSGDKELVSGSLDRSMKLWDLTLLCGTDALTSVSKQDGKDRQNPCLREYGGHLDTVLCAAVSRNKRWIVSGSTEGAVRFWNVGNAVWQVTIPNRGRVHSVDLTGRMLVTGGEDFKARIWRFGSTST